MRAWPCQALIRRVDLADVFYAFATPVARLRGGAEDWGRLEAELARWQRHGPDCLHPPGAAVGAFDYEGTYDFYFYDRMQVVSSDALALSSPTTDLPADESGWDCAIDREAYARLIRRAQEHIRAGDIYQVNLARRFSREVRDFDAGLYFRVLWGMSSAPLAAYLDLDGRILCSASPELFFGLQGRRVVTRPIKGTRPRDRDRLRDQQNAFELATSAKEVAELVMITDLERNDLGSVCEFGSVQVTSLLQCEAFSHVFHLISTVEGTLRREVSPLAGLRACFPGGSITGAPKKRAREIIRELEQVPRGCYTGAIGYFGFDGSAQFNIAIRTAEYAEGRLAFSSGCGITIDSEPEQEFDESEHKARVLRQAYRRYESIKNTAPASEGITHGK